MKFDQFSAKLSGAVQGDLPGFNAQSLLAPTHRGTPDINAEYYKNARLGGVLVLLYPHQEEIRTVLIRRPEYDGVHSRQIAFPGGKREEEDEDIIETALREAEEEVGVPRETVTVICPLSELYIPPSNFLVTPVLAYANERPNFVLQESEVDGILEPTIHQLLDDSLIAEHEIQVRGDMTITSPGLALGEYIVWGATAMMIAELREILRKVV